MGSQARVQNGLSGNLSQNGDTKSDPGKLEGILEDMEVSCCEDEHDQSTIRKTGSSWVVPREEGGEEGVVMGEWLSGGSVCVWGSSGRSKVGKLAASF